MEVKSVKLSVLSDDFHIRHYVNCHDRLDTLSDMLEHAANGPTNEVDEWILGKVLKITGLAYS